jgi:hypothetical protein
MLIFWIGCKSTTILNEEISFGGARGNYPHLAKKADFMAVFYPFLHKSWAISGSRTLMCAHATNDGKFEHLRKYLISLLEIRLKYAGNIPAP